MPVLNHTTDTNYSAMALSNITGITFNTAGYTEARFSSAQFGGASIANNWMVTGDNEINVIYVDMTLDAVFSAALWQFTSWPGSISDTLFFNGINGNETITGTSQIDIIEGGIGRDTLDGGGGNDVFVYNSPLAGASGESINGGTGHDEIRVQDAFTLTNLTAVGMTSVEQIWLQDDTGVRLMASQLGGTNITTVVASVGTPQTFNVHGAGANLTSIAFTGWTDGVDVINIYGSSASDTLNGSGQADTMHGGGGNDTLIGGNGNDLLVGDGNGGIGAAGSGSLNTSAGNSSTATAQALTGLFSTALNASIASSTSIPHVSIVSGTRAAPRIEYYLVETMHPGSQIILDVDGTGGSLDSLVQIRDVWGNLLDSNDDGGVLDTGSSTTTDSALTFTTTLPGVYYISIGAFSAGGNISNLDTNDTYTLHVSVSGERGTGSDSLTGGLGTDTLIGGLGGDTYVLDVSGDVIIESADEGNDTVRVSTGGYVLGTALENLELLDTADGVVGVGNELDNIIIGGGGGNPLVGLGGADQLAGGNGDDSLYFDNLDTVVLGGAGTDYAIVLNPTGGVSLDVAASQIEVAVGGSFGDSLLAGLATWSVTLVGQGGADQLAGGSAGDALYFDSLDTLISGNGGYDLAIAFQSAAITLNLNDAMSLELVAGGDFGDTLNASSLSFGVTLLGLGGADTLTGSNSNDAIYFDHLDTITGNAGFDWAYAINSSAVSLNMGARGVEGATGTSGADLFDASGVAIGAHVFANAGNDTMVSGVGADLFAGGADTDVVRYDGINSASASWANAGGTTWLVTIGGVTDTLVDVEILRFSNGDFLL